MEDNIQTRRVNPRALSSILTISMLVCLFITFCIGAFTTMRTVPVSVTATEIKWELVWKNCAPYLVFVLIAFLLGIVKFFMCTMPLRKEYPSKDTIKFQFIIEIIGLIMLLIGCLSLTFLLGTINVESEAIDAFLGTPNDPIIIVQAILLGIQVACGGLAYHNYK
ncbi:MAG: hypothetical protein ACOQNV_02515 [Mycoplasmoidaceae bacterium]